MSVLGRPHNIQSLTLMHFWFRFASFIEKPGRM